MSVGSIVRVIVLVALVALVVSPHSFAFAFEPLTHSGQPAIYVQNSLLRLTVNHLLVVGAAVGAATVIGVGLAILVTRPFGAEFLPLSRSLANIGQTFPPVAVLALCVPVLGFGTGPTFVALLLYGLLPIFENTLTGLAALPSAVREAARGQGMTERQRLLEVELPLAAPVILAGIRLSTVIALGTATVGSTVAASTLGEVIIAGLLSGNTAFVAQGGLIVAGLALLIYDVLAGLERRLLLRTGGAGT